MKQIHEHAWFQLEQGCHQRQHPFHIVTLGTLGPEGPQLRSLVLRRVFPDSARLIFHSDKRAPKVKEILAHSQVSLLFYSPAEKLQLRIQGEAQILDSGTLHEYAWSHSSLSSRRCYLSTQGPSSPLTGAPIPKIFQHRAPTLKESEEGRKYFSILVVQAKKLEVLELKALGHERHELSYIEGQVRDLLKLQP